MNRPRLHSTTISRVMFDKYGIEIGEHPIARHRKGGCKCPKD
jgi:hypothetical protein